MAGSFLRQVKKTPEVGFPFLWGFKNFMPNRAVWHEPYVQLRLLKTEEIS